MTLRRSPTGTAGDEGAFVALSATCYRLVTHAAIKSCRQTRQRHEGKWPTTSAGNPPEGGERTVPEGRAAGLLAAVLAVVSLSLAACGGSPSKAVAGLRSTTITSPSSGAQSPLSVALRFASCMRAKGVTNYPDPSNNGRPQSLNQFNASSPTFLRAFQACQKYVPVGEGIGPPPPSAAELRFALAFAQCIRKHDFPQFPDPIATAEDPAQGYFTLGRGMYFPKTARPSSGRRRSCMLPRRAECSFRTFPHLNNRRTAHACHTISARRPHVSGAPQELNGLSVEGAVHGDGGRNFCERSQWGYRHANFGAHRCLRTGSYGRSWKKSSHGLDHC